MIDLMLIGFIGGAAYAGVMAYAAYLIDKQQKKRDAEYEEHLEIERGVLDCLKIIAEGKKP